MMASWMPPSAKARERMISPWYSSISPDMPWLRQWEKIMICVNELFGMKCSKKEILNQFIIVLAPFAPHVCEELAMLLDRRELGRALLEV